MPERVQLPVTFLTWSLLAAGCGTLAAVLWRRLPGVRGSLVQQPLRPEMCDGKETWVLVLGYLFLPGLLHSILLYSGVFAWLLGPEHVVVTPAQAATAAQRILSQRRQPWLIILSCPLFFLLVRSAAQLHSDEPAAHMGFPLGRLRQDLLVGVLAGIVVTSAVNAVHAGVSWLFLEGFRAPPEDHPLTQLAQQTLAPYEWVALAASAVLAAPVMEELLFRGVLQRRWSRLARGGDAAMGAAFLMAILSRLGKFVEAWEQNGLTALLAETQPAWFVLALVPVYLLVRRRAATPAPPAIFGVALLFAAVHSAVWPTPIPLFVLGLGLGVLAHRTQSLIAPVVAHALFNAAACIVLLVLRA